MHTSTILQSSDFRYGQIAQQASASADFASLFPDYHELDRVGVVSLSLEDGILHVGGTLLALATAFYDRQRARGQPFFNYPQHFALFGENEGEIPTRSGTVPFSSEVVGPAWGNLDVWPESNWHSAPATVEGMLRKVFDLQINRLFWPEGFLPQSPGTRLPDYMGRILGSRLKAVYYYQTTMPTMAVEGSPQAVRILQRSWSSLSVGTGEAAGTFQERFRQVSASTFLKTMACCFEEGEA